MLKIFRQISNYWNRLDDWAQENAAGVLGTVAFHLVLILVFLIIKISAEKRSLESVFIFDFDQDEELMEELEEAPDPVFEQQMAEYLESYRSNVPVNLARQVEEDLSTDRYVDELEKEMDANRPSSYRELQEELNRLEDLEDEITMEDEVDSLPAKPEPYEGPTNIVYELKDRYHLRLSVPVYKCPGSGFIEVKIVVNQKGRVVQVKTDQAGKSTNEICLAQAAEQAALKTFFNADYEAPARQMGSITYHFIAQ